MGREVLQIPIRPSYGHYGVPDIGLCIFPQGDSSMGRQEKPLAELVKNLRATYPKGSRVVLVQMDDVQAPPIGTQGTVQGVDDIETIMVHWDNGSHLGVVLGADIYHKIQD